MDIGTLRCELVHGRRGLLARESAVQNAPLLVAAEVREVQSGTGKDRTLNVLLSMATMIKEDWLRELFLDDFQETQQVVYDETLRRVFVERQKRITLDGEDFYLDLLFYHRHLRRLVAIDLKLEAFKPGDKGQMELYLRWLDRYERKAGEEKPIGLIL